MFDAVWTNTETQAVLSCGQLGVMEDKQPMSLHLWDKIKLSPFLPEATISIFLHQALRFSVALAFYYLTFFFFVFFFCCLKLELILIIHFYEHQVPLAVITFKQPFL